MSEPRVLGPYTLLSELGSGGMGTVHLAEAGDEAIGLSVGQKVAVKIVHPQLVSTPGFFKRFMREAEVGKKIDHENVVRTIDVDAAEFDGRTVSQSHNYIPVTGPPLHPNCRCDRKAVLLEIEE